MFVYKQIRIIFFGFVSACIGSCQILRASKYKYNSSTSSAGSSGSTLNSSTGSNNVKHCSSSEPFAWSASSRSSSTPVRPSVYFECFTRIRVLCRQNDCPICRRDLAKVISKTLAPYRELDVKNQFELYDKQYRTDGEVQQAFFELLDNKCPRCDEKNFFKLDILQEHGHPPADRQSGHRRPSGPSALRVLRQIVPGQGRTVSASAEDALILPLLRCRWDQLLLR
ncbi:E3 ubiquitin-protein ligase ZNF598-like [Aedes albopictus]|uniref:Secreted protein n=1 Tax=Aedes albopictus TaxID=7160 RepID=A0ABM1ZTE1_AEDAL